MMHALERTGTRIKNQWLGDFDERRMRWIRRIYEWILLLVTFGRGLPRLINGEDVIRVSVHHRYVDEVYEPEVFRLLKQELNQDDVIIDVGAYIGIYSIILSRYLGGKGRIYAFEPAPDSLNLLKEHLDLNGVRGNVEVLPYAVGEKSGTGSLFASGDHIQNSFSSGAIEGEAGIEVVEVRMVSLDDFCLQRSIAPTWIKVDTEGWELPVLRGAAHLLANHITARFIVEMHPYAWKYAGYDERIFRQFCVEHDLRVEPLSNQNDVFAEYGQVLISRNA